jgi:tripartite-type tricarboxylate transporter receptor subunit TctC
MISRRRLLQASALAATGLAPGLALPALAQQGWPNRFVRLVVPFPAGGGADAIARIVGGRLSEIWGQQVTIENRGGASGNLAAENVAHSPPDGYTMFIAGDFHAVNQFLFPKLNYDPVADFAPVSMVVQYTNAMTVPINSPAQTVKEFIALAKTKQLSFASPGHGTSGHLSGELFMREAGIKLTVIPYRGANPAIQDLIPGRVDFFANNLSPLISLHQQKQVRILALTTNWRSPQVPEVPTMAESGLPGFDVSGWYSFFVPAKTPTEIVRKMNADTVAVLAEPTIKKKLEDLGLRVIGSTAEQLGQSLKADMDKWGPLIKAAGITAAE